jgi:hypothetical protein
MDLDDVVPAAEHVTRQERVIAAPPAVVWDELHKVTLSSLPLSTLLIGIRFLPRLIVGLLRGLPRDRPFVELIPLPLLSEAAPAELVFGGLLQPWRPLGGAEPRALDAPALRAWKEPGWVKAGMDFRLIPQERGTTLRTETRVAATDLRTRALFAAYWLVVRPGSSMIREEVLATVARRAEARAPSTS